MKLLTNTLIAVLAITGICAVLYLCWQAYQQRNQEERARAERWPDPIFGVLWRGADDPKLPGFRCLREAIESRATRRD
jgi:hypothetical protein